MSAASAPPPAEANPNMAMPRANGGNGARWLVLKAAVTFALLAYLASKIDLVGLETKLRTLALSPLALAAAIIMAEVPIVAFRWMVLARRTGAQMSYMLALRLTFAGLFFGQVLPASIGGDVVRGWLGAGNGVALQPLIASLILDRLIALLAAVMLIAAALPWITATTLQMSAQISIVVVLVVLGGLFVDLLPLPAPLKNIRLVSTIRDLISQTRRSLFSKSGAGAVLISLAVHVMTIVAVTAIAASLGVGDVISASAIVVPVALVAAAMPVSVNGWGVREGVMVAGFAVFGVAQTDAFLISVLLGFSVVLSALPGGLTWLNLR